MYCLLRAHITLISLAVMWAVAFAYGSVLVEDGDCTFAQMMKAISAIAFGAMMLGQVFGYEHYRRRSSGRVEALW